MSKLSPQQAGLRLTPSIALGAAAAGENTNIARMILDDGFLGTHELAELPTSARDGWGPLHWAAANEHADIVQLLLSKGIDPNVKSHAGERPADIAAKMVMPK